MKRILGYFLQGLILVAPVAIVIYILHWIFVTVDGWLSDKIEILLGISVPGLGILFLFVSLTILGLIGKTALINPIKRIAERFIKLS